MAKKEKKPAIEEIITKETKQQHFDDLMNNISNLNIAEYWNKSKYVIGEYIISQLINGNIRSYDEFYNAVLKACYKKDREFLKIDLNTFCIANEEEAVDKFLKDKVFMFADINHYNSFNKLFRALADDTVLRMGMKFGQIISRDAYATLGSVVKLRDCKSNDAPFFEALAKAFSKNGFKISKDNENFLETTTQFEETVCEEAQASLLKTYYDMYKNYIVQANHLNNIQDLEDFVRYWDVVKTAFENIENRLTKQSKKFVYSSPVSIQPGWSFEEIKSKKDLFFDKILRQVEKNYIAQQQEQKCNLKLLESCRKFAISGEKNEYVKDFLHRMDLFNKSLETKSGKTSYANYFLFAKESPSTSSFALRKLRDKTKFLSEEEKGVIYKAADNIRSIFGTNPTIAEYCFDLEDLLGNYKNSVRKNLDGIITLDTSTDEKYQKFLERVEQTLIKHNLPFTKQCIKAVVSSISRGFEPVDKQAAEQAKEIDFSLPKDKTKRAPKEKI